MGDAVPQHDYPWRARAGGIFICDGVAVLAKAGRSCKAKGHQACHVSQCHFHLEATFSGSKRAKPNTSVAEAMATYWVPLTKYVIGCALIGWPVLKCQTGLPVLAFNATNSPLSSPEKIRPPAVDSSPPPRFVEPTRCCSHTCLPVVRSRARTYTFQESSWSRTSPPARY